MEIASALTLSGLLVLSCVLAFLLGAGRAGIVLVLLAPVALYIADKVGPKDAVMVILIVGAFLLPVFGSAIGLGLLAGWLLRRRSNWCGGLLVAFLLAVIWGYYGVLTVKSARAEREAKREMATAIEYVNGHPRLLALEHGPVHARLPTKITYADPSQGRYEFLIGRHFPAYYAIVDVRRAGGSATFTLACITTLCTGQRDAHAETCAQALVALPQLEASPR